MHPFPFPTDRLKDVEWSAVAPEKIIEGAPRSACKIFYTSADEKFYAGIYECTAGKWRVSYDEDEFCTLIEGAVRLISESGDIQEFSAPASFLIPRGFKGFWEPLGKLRKFFVIYEQGVQK